MAAVGIGVIGIAAVAHATNLTTSGATVSGTVVMYTDTSAGVNDDSGITPLSNIAANKILGHTWHSRWRWQSAPRPIIRTTEQLVAERALLPIRHVLPPSETVIQTGVHRE
jgi:hypothetical protein